MNSYDNGNPAFVVSSTGLGSLGFVVWLVFLILKCNNILNISWFWVWFPLWIIPAIELAFIIIAIPVIYFVYYKE